MDFPNNSIVSLHVLSLNVITLCDLYFHWDWVINQSNFLHSLYVTELVGKPLIFVLNLDEAEIVQSQKLERVSITLMNRALNPDITIGSEEYFVVQSEREIWPVGSFQIPKESHEILSWVFNQTRISALIEAQEAGQKLTIRGIGDFAVEWHLCRYEKHQMHVWIKSRSLCKAKLHLLSSRVSEPDNWNHGTSSGNIL